MNGVAQIEVVQLDLQYMQNLIGLLHAILTPAQERKPEVVILMDRNSCRLWC